MRFFGCVLFLIILLPTIYKKAEKIRGEEMHFLTKPVHAWDKGKRLRKAFRKSNYSIDELQDNWSNWTYKTRRIYAIYASQISSFIIFIH